jgi:hypothetical protein
MTVKPMLGDWEVPRIASLETLEKRSFVELAIPGQTGSLYQDMNTCPTGIAIRGSLYGEEKRNEFLEALREKYFAGEPVTFVADILTATEVQYVIIESMHLEESGTRPDQMDYVIVLRESPPPPPPPDPLGGIDTGLLDDAGNLLDSVSGALDLIDSIGSVPDISNPTPPINDALDGVTAATSGLEDTLAPLTDIFGSDD